jgi:putative peptidoglycan lipid II flippase
MISEEKHITKAASVVGFATLLSRIMGFLRDMVVARSFGAGMMTDAFFIAFRIPNMLRRFLAEGSLVISIVPVFNEYITLKTKEETNTLAKITFTFFFIVLAAVSILGILLSPLIIRLIAPGFISNPEKLRLAILLNRIMFPYLFFVGLVALSMGILNSYKHFFAPSFAPVFLNISMIVAVIGFSSFFTPPIVALSLGVIAGGVLQVLFQIPFLKNKGITFGFTFNFSHPALKRIGLLMFPLAFGATVYQVNILVSNFLASFLPGGSISYLYYADRMVEFPLGVFGIALGDVVLPFMTAQAAKKDYESMMSTLSYALRLMLFITLPCMVGLIVLRIPILSLLFQRGEFSYQDTLMTAQALFYYTLGLWAFAGVRIVAPTFYSLQDMWTPVKIAVLAVVINVITSLILMGPLKHGGLALATSIAASFNLIALVYILRKRFGRIGMKRIVASGMKIMVSSLIMGLAVYLVCPQGYWGVSGMFLEKIFWVLLSITFGLVIFLVSSYFLRSQELFSLLDFLKSKRR